MSAMDLFVPLPPNSYLEALTPNVTVLGLWGVIMAKLVHKVEP